MKLVTRRLFALALLLLLGACAVVPQIKPNPNVALNYQICGPGAATPPPPTAPFRG